MNSIFTTKRKLKTLLSYYKNFLTKELYDYLDSLIELKFSVLSNNISEESLKCISNSEFFYNVSLYNIYEQILSILKSLDVLPILEYTEKSNTRLYYESLIVNGVYIPKQYKKAEEYQLLTLDYNFKSETKIILNLFRKDIPINSDIEKLNKEEKESLISNELIKSLLEKFEIKENDFEETQILKRTKRHNEIKMYKKGNVIITQTKNYE